MKKNCWEVMECGREPGGKEIDHLGICPASTEIRADGIHEGLNGGRCCWAIEGTLCGGRPQKDVNKKQKDCLKCKFYYEVREEEEENFQTVLEIFKQIS